MKCRFIVMYLFLCMAPCVAFAGFTFKDKPISPECLATLINNDHDKQATVLLKQCSSPRKARQVKYSNNVFTTRTASDDSDEPFSNYAVIGQYGNKYLIDFGQWTGGSGFFTSIMWVEFLGDQIKLLKVIAGGDRCNGGTEKTGLWEYGVNLTSVDLIELSDDKSIKMKSYRDLDASAAGCVAEAHYSFNPDTVTARFTYVVLDKDMDTTVEWAKDFKYQVCLNEIFESYLNKGKYKLDLAGVKKLAKEFKDECIYDH